MAKKKRGRPPGKSAARKTESGCYDPNVTMDKPIPEPPDILPDATENPHSLTPNEEKALRWIIAFMQRHCWSPSTVELAHLMDISAATATKYFQVLHLKGHITNAGTRQVAPFGLLQHMKSYTYRKQVRP